MPPPPLYDLQQFMGEGSNKLSPSSTKYSVENYRDKQADQSLLQKLCYSLCCMSIINWMQLLEDGV